MELADMRLIKDSMEIREGFLEKVTPDLDLEGSVRYFQVDKGDNILDKREKPVQRSKRVYTCNWSIQIYLYTCIFRWCPEKAEWSCMGNMGSRHRKVSRGGRRVRREGWERKRAKVQLCPCCHLPSLGTEEDKNFLFLRKWAVCSGLLCGYLYCCLRPLVH